MVGFSRAVPSDSLRYLLVCVLGVILFFAIAIYPSARSISNLETKINELRFQVERQKSLYPLYAQLKKRIDSSEPPALNLPEPAVYPRDRIDRVSSAFDTVIEGSGVFLTDVAPDVRTLAGDSSLLPVRVVLTGSFMNFQKFLIRLGSLPFITHIEEVQAKQIPGSRQFEVKVWFAIGD